MPTLTIIAGPNGSGKSTLTRSFDFEGRDRLLDPDAIARGMSPANPSAAAIGDDHRLILVANAGVIVWQAEPLPAWVKL